MAYTNQDAVNQVRPIINDKREATYSDEDILEIINQAILRLRQYRPDFFIGQFSSLPSQKTLTDTISFPEEILPAVIDYVAARCDLANDEAALRQRASSFYQLFTQDTKG